MVSDHLRSPGYRSSLTETSSGSAFAFGSLATVTEFHLYRCNTHLVRHLSLRTPFARQRTIPCFIMQSTQPKSCIVDCLEHVDLLTVV